jgi:hypothetical protein
MTTASPVSTDRDRPGGDPAGQARCGRRAQPGHRRDLLPGRVLALPVQPHQEVFPGQLRRRQPGQQLPGLKPRFRSFTGPTAASSAPITPRRSHSPLTAAIPAFGVSAAKGRAW